MGFIASDWQVVYNWGVAYVQGFVEEEWLVTLHINRGKGCVRDYQEMPTIRRGSEGVEQGGNRLHVFI